MKVKDRWIGWKHLGQIRERTLNREQNLINSVQDYFNFIDKYGRRPEIFSK